MFSPKATKVAHLLNCSRIREIARSGFLLYPAILLVAMLVTPIDAKGSNHRDRPEFNVAVISSAVNQVTGGDARLHIEVPPLLQFQWCLYTHGLVVCDLCLVESLFCRCVSLYRV